MNDQMTFNEARDSRHPESEGRVVLQRLVRRAVAFSIRQPWAWLIVNGYKDVENRSWWCGRRGPVLIHAGKTMTRDDYAACMIFIAGIAPQLSGGWRVPAYDILRQQCGGIVGEAEIVDCVTGSKSPWFVGGYGLVLKNQRTLPFEPCKGALGFFEASTSNR